MSRYYSKTGGGWVKGFDVPVDLLCYLFNPPPFTARKRGVFYDLFMIGTIDDAGTVKKQRRCGGV